MRSVLASRTSQVIPRSAILSFRPLILTGVTVLWLAWALRVFRLDYQSLWYDEGISAALAVRSLSAITTAAAADIHPPVYYYLLHFWATVAGASEFALRLPSALFAVAATAFTAKIGEMLFGRTVGWLSAVLLAVSPLAVYYGQEVRAYSLAMVLAAVSMYCFVAIVVNGKTSRRVTAAYGLATAAMLYTHYLTVSVVLAQDAYYMVDWLIRRKRAVGSGILGRWIAGQALALLAFAPWLALVYERAMAYPAISEAMAWDELARHAFRSFSFGVGWDASYTPRREQALVVIFVIGILAGIRRRTRQAALVLATVAVPVLVIFLLSQQQPMFKPRFLLPIAPAYYLWAAGGVVGLGYLSTRVVRALGSRPSLERVVRVAAVVLGVLIFVYPATWSLVGYYFDPKYSRDDYRGVARIVEEAGSPGDAIVLVAPGQIEIFEYYYRGGLPRYPLPKQRPIDERDTEGKLTAIAQQHRRVWLVLWAVEEADPNRIVEQWLVRRGANEFEESRGAIRLQRYGIARGDK